jgi:3-hydroxyisobutyrate dehydrogenase
MEALMKEPVGFIGLGNMGLGMAKNLLRAGFSLVAHDIREDPLQEVSELGAQVVRTPLEVGQKAAISILVLLNYSQIEQVVFGGQGLQEGVKSNDVIVIMSTISPVQVKEIAQKLKNKGVHLLDAPISGGKEGAEAGTLAIMVGGEKTAFDRCQPVFQAMGKNIYHLGGLGSGMSMKLVNNLLVAVNGLAVAEAITLGTRAGLDPKTILEVIPRSAGDSWMFRNRAPQMVCRDFTCRGELNILIKDLGYILDLGRSVKTPLFLGAVAREIFQVASSLGWGKEDDSAVVKVIEKMAGIGDKF